MIRRAQSLNRACGINSVDVTRSLRSHMSIPQMNLARIVSRGTADVAVAGNNFRLVWQLGG